MKRSLALFAALLGVLVTGIPREAAACDTCGGKKKAPVKLMAGLGAISHPVSTKNPMAQKFFDQGLALVYAFNHEEAVRAFQRAAELDPQMAMAYWGVAHALGPNYNMDIDAAREKQAYEAIQKALTLSVNSPAHERAAIEAMAKRYTNQENPDLKKLAVDYKSAMFDLAKRYPDDPDIVTLAAESAMNLRPWQLWTPDGKPAEGTEEIIALLESVLRRNPDHTGANHFYIHAVEASRHPDRAIGSANRLERVAPMAGHLVHMASHVYARIGDFDSVIRSNEGGTAADEVFIGQFGKAGLYPVMYYSHNLHFLSIGHATQGRYALAKRSAEKLAENVKAEVKTMPMLEQFSVIPINIEIWFRRWDNVLKMPQPDAKATMDKANWHFARTLAYIGKERLADAQTERKALATAIQAVPKEAIWGFNSAHAILKIAEAFADAHLAFAAQDTKTAIAQMKQAVEMEDALNYGEPPDWVFPTRPALGALYLRTGDTAEAEKVFRADLEKNRRSPRSLYGLAESLKAQNREYEAKLVREEFQNVWKKADAPLRNEDMFFVPEKKVLSAR